MNTEEEITQLKDEIKKIKLRLNRLRYAIKEGAEKTEQELDYLDWKAYGQYDVEYEEGKVSEEEWKQTLDRMSKL